MNKFLNNLICNFICVGGFVALSLASPISGPVSVILRQADGKFLVGGHFSEYMALVRLNSDGNEDPGFSAKLENSTVSALQLRADGKLLVGGYFGTTEASPLCQGLLVLGADGALDRDFCQKIGPGFDSKVETVIIQPDNKILVGGSFSSFNNKKAQGLVRLSPDGTIDDLFQQQMGEAISSLASVKSIAVQSDGKILVLGNFQRFHGKPSEGLVRLNSDGTEDVDFSLNVNKGLFTGFTAVDEEEEIAGLEVFLSKVGLQADGKILVSGEFVIHDEADVVYKVRLIRLETDGRVDLPFVKNVAGIYIQSDLNTFALLPDNKIILGSNSPFVCLNADGTRDPAYVPVAKNSFGGGISAIVPVDDGKLIVGGFFGRYRGVEVSNLLRLNVDGTLDESFMPNSAP